MLECAQQGDVRDSDETLQRLAQFKDEKDGCGNSASSQKKDREGGGMRRSKQTEAGEKEGKPENQNDEEWKRQLVLLLFNQQAAGLTKIVDDLLRLGESLPLKVVLRRKLVQLVPNEIHDVGALEGSQCGHAGFLRRPDHFDAGGESTL